MESKTLYETIKAAQHNFKTEEDVRVHCEAIFMNLFHEMGIAYDAKYEVKISTGSVDALFRNLCLEYKRPGLLQRHFDEFVEEKVKYIRGISDRYHTKEDQIFCVLFDGIQMGFFRKTSDGRIIKNGPYDLSPQILSYFVQMARSFRYKALVSENLINDLGENSRAAKRLVPALWKAFNEAKDVRTKMFHLEWARMFGQVSDVGHGKESVLKEANNYHLTLSTEAISSFIFVLHTAYAIYIKLIALMIMRSLRESNREPFPEIAEGKELKLIAQEIEQGDEFQRLGIKNFLEGDFFCWYAFEWNAALEEAFHFILKKVFNEYAPSSVSLKPEVIKDLLKELYEGLLSKSMRHSMGEYYTPDWLADFTIQESGWEPHQKALDPTCGSGTFLVHLINRSARFMKDEGLTNPQIVQRILSQIYGFDLNPLAIISARTNYLIALYPYLEDVGEIEIPVYLTDAIFSPRKEGLFYTYKIDTQEGVINLKLPEEVFNRQILSPVLEHIDKLAKYSTGEHPHITYQEAEQELDMWGLPDADKESLVALLHCIRNLETRKWDGIWCNIIKNHFTAAQLHDFDVIIGNPPWLRWSSLPENYRKTIKDFCRVYGLFSSDVFYGGIESDVSTMVLYAAAQKWLKKDGKLAMLITRSVFKSESSEGFRRFALSERESDFFCVKSVQDFTRLKPFQNATNKTTLIVLSRGSKKTYYPLPWIVWDKNSPFTERDSLKKVISCTSRSPLVAHPISDERSPWLTVPSSQINDCLKMARGANQRNYVARKGICTDMNGVYYGTSKGNRGKFILFENDPTLGRKNIPKREHLIEKELIFPIARGREISPFAWQYSGLVGILPQKRMTGFPLSMMSERYRMALDYFDSFRPDLESRSSLKRYLPNSPFYSCWNVGAYSFAPYKVCWSEISGHFRACVLSTHNGRCVIPDHKIYFIPTDSENEAYYLCTFLNANIVEDLIMGYAENTQIGTHITEYLYIPKYDSQNTIHSDMARLARNAISGNTPISDARKEANDYIHELFKKESL